MQILKIEQNVIKVIATWDLLHNMNIRMNLMCAGLVGGIYYKAHNQSVANGDLGEVAPESWIFWLWYEASAMWSLSFDFIRLELQASQGRSFQLHHASKLPQTAFQ